MKHFSLMIVSLFLFSFFAFAQNNANPPRLEADAQAFTFARMGQSRNYTWQEMLDMALWASGADYSQESPARNKILISGETLPESEYLPSNKNDQGEYLLNFMHQTFLKNYSVQQTKLDLLVSTGRFNCVSSAVLYAILASSVGLETNGVLTRDHAFVQVNTGAELIDVETTNSYGYNPGSKKEFHDGFGTSTGFAYVAPRNYRDRSPISQLELVSLILTNRIADLDSRGFFADAVGIAIDKAALLSLRTNPSTSTFFANPDKDVMDRIFNYGASLIQAGKEEEALAWADTAESTYPDERWQGFVFAAVNNRLVEMIRTKKVSDARVLLDTEASRFIPENYAKLETLVTDAELMHISTLASTSEDAERALEAIARIEHQSILSAARIKEIRTFVLLKESERRAKYSNWQDAILYLENALSTYGNDTQLQQTLNVYKNNKAIDLHNQFAVLYNAHQFEEAHQFVLNALEEFPGNRQLSSDLRMVENALNRN
jgi:tetratricopeptide (TPR) repeat protein